MKEEVWEHLVEENIVENGLGSEPCTSIGDKKC